MNQKKTDILIIGVGLAGMTAAITAAKSGKKITMITKTDSLVSGNTPWAQGGIVYKGLNDSPEKLKRDILTAGDGHCWEEAVDHLCQHGPRLVDEILINTLKTQFNINPNNKELKRVAEGAHSDARVIYDQDRTGKSIHQAALYYLQQLDNVEILVGHTAIDLLTFSHHSKESTDIYKKPACFGAMVLNNENQDVFPILSSMIIAETPNLSNVLILNFLLMI